MPKEDAAPSLDHGEKPARRRSLLRGLWFLLAFLVLILVVPGTRPWQGTPPPPAPVPTSQQSRPPQSALSSSQIAKCDEMIRRGQELGLIRRRPAPQRIDIDEAAWAAMDVTEKRGLLLALRCSALRGVGGGTVLAYSATSGKRLAQGSEAGVSLE